MPTFYSLRSYQLLLAFALCSASMFAQSDSDIADLKKQKEALQLQLDVINIQKTLTAAQQAPSASSTQKDQLQAEKDIQDIKNSMAASQLARVKAEIGSINTTNLPKGDAVLTNVDIQPTILGYKALKKAITEIELTKNEFCPDGTRPIVLGSGPPEDVAVLSAYQAIIKIFSDNLGRLQSPPDYEHPAAMFVPPAAIFAGIDAVVALSSLFKIDVSMTGVAITPSEKAVRFLIAAQLSGTCTVIDLNDFTGPTLAMSPLGKSIVDLDSNLVTALKVQSEIKTKKIPEFTKEISDAKDRLAKFDMLTKEVSLAHKTLDDRKTISAEKINLRKTIASDEALLKTLHPEDDKKKQKDNEVYLRIANTRVDAVDRENANATKLFTSLYKIDDAGTPFLSRLLKAEAVKAKIEGARFLTTVVAKIGGNNIVRKNAFHTSIKYAGGIVLTYQLKDNDGLTVLKSGQKVIYATADGKDDTLAKELPVTPPTPAFP